MQTTSTSQTPYFNFQGINNNYVEIYEDDNYYYVPQFIPDENNEYTTYYVQRIQKTDNNSDKMITNTYMKFYIEEIQDEDKLDMDQFKSDWQILDIKETISLPIYRKKDVQVYDENGNSIDGLLIYDNDKWILHTDQNGNPTQDIFVQDKWDEFIKKVDILLDPYIKFVDTTPNLIKLDSTVNNNTQFEFIGTQDKWNNWKIILGNLFTV